MNTPGESYDSVDAFIAELKKQMDDVDPYHWDDNLEAFIRAALSRAYMDYWA